MSDGLPPLCGSTDDVCPPEQGDEAALWILLPIVDDGSDVEYVAVLGYN